MKQERRSEFLSRNERYEQCPRCVRNGRDTARDNLQVYPDGGKHCHSCNYHESGNVVSKVSKSSIKADEIIELPYGISEVPDWVNSWLSKYQLTTFDFKRSYYSPYIERYIFPVGNSWIGRSNVEGSKLTNFGNKWLNKPEPLLIRKDKRKDAPLVVVEDLLSGVKVGRLFNSLTLFGTNIPMELLLRHNNVILWLDGDMKQKVVKLSMQLNSLGVKTRRLWTDKDPKCYTYSEIYKWKTYENETGTL